MATLKEIAALSGYSASTVSVVLSGKGAQRGIPETTQKRIWDAAASLHYKPNIAARALRDHDNEGVFFVALFWAQDFRAPMIIRFLRGLRKCLEHTGRRDIKFIINFYDNDRLCEEEGLKSQSYYHAAIVCNASAKDMEFLEQAELPIPIILYNRKSSRYNSVIVDDSQFGAIAAQVFSSHGKRTAQIITSAPVFTGMDVRSSAFLASAQGAGIEIFPTITCPNSMSGGYEAAMRIAKQPRIPEGIFCASDAIALGVLRAFHETGIHIPGQAELVAVGNGDQEQEIYAIPSLSAVVLPMEDMAARCLTRLLEIQTAPFSPPEQEYLELRYVARESCGPKM